MPMSNGPDVDDERRNRVPMRCIGRELLALDSGISR